MKQRITNDNREKLFNLLIKEDFRDFIVSKNKGNKYVIDNPDYTSMPNAIACLEREHSWHVYETDERSKVCNEKTFELVTEAYEDAALRSGVIFNPSPDILKINPNSSFSPYRNYITIPIPKIKKALDNAQEIADLMSGEPNGILAKENAKFLNETLKKCRSVSKERHLQRRPVDSIYILENNNVSRYRPKVRAFPVKLPHPLILPMPTTKAGIAAMQRNSKKYEHIAKRRYAGNKGNKRYHFTKRKYNPRKI